MLRFSCWTIFLFGAAFALLQAAVLADRESQKCKDWRAKIGDKWLKKADGVGIYHYFLSTYNWHEAVKFCNETGMHLATIKSKEEFDVVEDLRPFSGFWVAASDKGRTPGQYHWTDDGSKVDPTFIGVLDDEFGKGEDTCLYLRGKLYDYVCDRAAHSIVCEVGKEFEECY